MFEKLCKLIADQFGVEPDSVKADTAFVDDLGADRSEERRVGKECRL